MSKTATTANSNDLVRLYQVANTETGEITSKYKYLTGSPKNYRFDGRTGDFNIGGIKPVGKKIVIQPIAFRFMQDSLFARKDDTTGVLKLEQWCEVYFVDESKAVCYIMFNNSSARSLLKLVESLYYEDIVENGIMRSMELTDTVLTIASEKKENSKGKYSVATFDFEIAQTESIEEYRQFCQDFQVFSRDTITETAQIGLCSKLYPVAVLPNMEVPALLN